MKKTQIINKVFLFGMLLSMTSMLPLKSAHAVLTCAATDFYSKTVPLIANSVSAGDELPLGTVIYRGTVEESNGAAFMSCNSTIANDLGYYDFNLGIDSAPMPLSSWSGSPFPGAVYQTNIPGIGIAVWYSGNGVTTANPYAIGSNKFIRVTDPATTANIGHAATFDISLVKIGPTPPGSYVINSSSFPTVKLYFSPRSNMVGPTTISRRINFSGSVNVTAPTCTTPDVNVELGKYDVNTIFPSLGKTSPWIDFSVQLTNCPVFQGYYSSAVMLNNSSGGTNIPAATTNKIGMVLTPQTPVVNASQGTFQLAPSATAAQGIAIQLATVNGSTKSMVNFANEYKYNMPSTNGSSFTIPMAARYISTSSTVRPGIADGKVTFTINYY